MRNALIAAAALATATTASAGFFSDCDHSAPRSLSSPIAGVTKVIVIGHAGTLKVEGRSGAGDVRANGTACASSESLLHDIALRATRAGNELRIEADIPEDLFTEQASLDFTVTLPNNIPVVVKDGSGSLEVVNTASADITDGSGELIVKGVNGDVAIQDGSGSIDVSDVTGQVRIRDGSGSIDVARAGSVLVEADGSGSIDVADIRGDFTVGQKGSGSIDYERVGGKVNVPERSRR